MNHLDKWPKFKKNQANDYYDNQLERYQIGLGIVNPIKSNSTTDNRFVGYYQGNKNEALVIMYQCLVFCDGQTPNTNTYYPVETGWLTAPALPKNTIPYLEVNNAAPFNSTAVFWQIENSPIRQTIINNIEASPYSYKIALDIDAEYIFEVEARPFATTIGRGPVTDPAFQPDGDNTGRTAQEIHTEIIANITNDEWGTNSVSTLYLTNATQGTQRLFNTTSNLGATERLKGIFRIQNGQLTSDEVQTRYDNMNPNPTQPTIISRNLRCRTRARLTPNGYLYFDTSGFNLSGQDDHAFLVRVYINKYL